jgi:phosphopantothenoylcysteine decarboxylase/phosphopantothenate--cysteine ligase
MLIKAGAEVQVVMTPAARDFVTPLSLSTLSKHPVQTELFANDAWSNHVMLGRWADLFLLAPLSCNTIAKMAAGLCDNLLLATWLSSVCPVVLAPAMDEDMWKHPVTKANLEKLTALGHHIIPVENGELASGLFGEGRMAEPESIVAYLEAFFSSSQDLKGKRALVTAGPTYEAIDPVRFIGNHSSGKMGIAIATELARRGAMVDLILGPGNITVQEAGIAVKRVRSASEMYEAALASFEQANIAVMAAAVADYTPSDVAAEKIKKSEGELVIRLTKTKDILKSLGEKKKAGQVLVGFALETNNERKNAIEKMQRKQADLMVLNSLRDQGAGFGHDTNKVTIFEKDGKEWNYEQKPKQQVAKDIVDRIVNIQYV